MCSILIHIPINILPYPWAIDFEHTRMHPELMVVRTASYSQTIGWSKLVISFSNWVEPDPDKITIQKQKCEQVWAFWRDRACVWSKHFHNKGQTCTQQNMAPAEMIYCWRASYHFQFRTSDLQCQYLTNKGSQSACVGFGFWFIRKCWMLWWKKRFQLLLTVENVSKMGFQWLSKMKMTIISNCLVLIKWSPTLQAVLQFRKSFILNRIWLLSVKHHKMTANSLLYHVCIVFELKYSRVISKLVHPESVNVWPIQDISTKIVSKGF